jgi:hypothetical protein
VFQVAGSHQAVMHQEFFWDPDLILNYARSLYCMIIGVDTEKLLFLFPEELIMSG